MALHREVGDTEECGEQGRAIGARQMWGTMDTEETVECCPGEVERTAMTLEVRIRRIMGKKI